MGGKVSRQVAWNWLLSFMVSRPKPWKSRSRTQWVISAMRPGTTASARNCEAREISLSGAQRPGPEGRGTRPGRPPAPTHPSLTLSRGLVSTLVRMPAVLPISLRSALTCTETDGLDPGLRPPARNTRPVPPPRARVGSGTAVPPTTEVARSGGDGAVPGAAARQLQGATGRFHLPRQPPLPASLTTSMRTRSSGQCDSGATCRATLSFPSARSPICHSTKPPYRLRQALPEPRRATSERSLSTP